MIRNHNQRFVRQAIVTKWLAPTNTRQARVKATAAAGSLTVTWDHALGAEDNYARAAHHFASKLGWGGNYYMGALPDGRFCFVVADNQSTPSFRVEDKE